MALGRRDGLERDVTGSPPRPSSRPRSRASTARAARRREPPPRWPGAPSASAVRCFAPRPCASSRERALEELDEVVDLERLEAEHLAAREERRVDGEARVLRRRADDDDRAVLDVRQERVLLRLVEAVDLVDEDDRPLALEGQAIARRGDDLAQLADAPEHGAERDEVRLRRSGDDARERRLAAPRRAPEDHRAHAVGGDRLGQERLRPEHVLLADEVGERLRPHAVGERRPALGALLRRRGEERVPPRRSGSGAGAWPCAAA